MEAGIDFDIYNSFFLPLSFFPFIFNSSFSFLSFLPICVDVQSFFERYIHYKILKGGRIACS